MTQPRPIDAVLTFGSSVRGMLQAGQLLFGGPFDGEPVISVSAALGKMTVGVEDFRASGIFDEWLNGPDRILRAPRPFTSRPFTYGPFRQQPRRAGPPSAQRRQRLARRVERVHRK